MRIEKIEMEKKLYLKDKNQLDHVIDFGDKKRIDRVKDDNWMKGDII